MKTAERSIFNNPDLYPTPSSVIDIMLTGQDVAGKVILEPSAGLGDIVDHLKLYGAGEIIACEKSPELVTILKEKCKVIANDFLEVKAEHISHINFIIMNPPFSADEKHILHAYDIAPAGCKIIALCNLNTVKNPYTEGRKRLLSLANENGGFKKLGDCFSDSERSTGVEIAMITLQKTGGGYETEFDGFFTDEEVEDQSNGIMPYNMIRDLVNRYVGAIKIYDEQLDAAVKMNSLTEGFYSAKIGMSIKSEDRAISRADFKKELQKSGWNFIFNKLNMQKYATKGLKEDINKFVEQQVSVPFSMRNIYKMLELIVGTQGQRMDKAMLEVFEKLTKHYDENRYNLEGWKTNSHYLMGEKFIMPYMCPQEKWNSGDKIDTNYSSYFETISDFLKALCYITGDDYGKFLSQDSTIRYDHYVDYNGRREGFTNDIHYSGAYSKIEELKKKGVDATYTYSPARYGEWFDWAYFEVKAFKKGTMHFKFKSKDLWAQFNQRIAKLMGYPLYENVKTKTK